MIETGLRPRIRPVTDGTFPLPFLTAFGARRGSEVTLFDVSQALIPQKTASHWYH
jgi:hypothetical protein